jgi:hypothetical protein
MQVVTDGPSVEASADVAATGFMALAVRLSRPRPAGEQRAQAKYSIRMMEAWEIASGTRKSGRKGAHLRAAIDDEVKRARLGRKNAARIYTEWAEIGEGVQAWIYEEPHEQSFGALKAVPDVSTTLVPPKLPTPRPMTESLVDEMTSYPERFQLEVPGSVGSGTEAHRQPLTTWLEPTDSELQSIHREVRYLLKGETILKTEASRRKERVRKQTAARVKKHASRKRLAAMTASSQR